MKCPYGNPLLVFIAHYLNCALFEEEQVQDDHIQSEASYTLPAAVNHRTVLHVLLHHNVMANSTDTDGNTALHVACERGITGMVKALLQLQDIDVNLKDNQECTPLHIACSGSNTSIVKALVDAGADVALKNDCQMNPLQVALVNKNAEMAETILANDKIAESREHLLQGIDQNGHSIFLSAVKLDDEKLVQFLLDNKLVKVTDTNARDENAFHLASSVKILEAIYNYDQVTADSILNDKDKDNYTPLHRAVEHQSDQVDKVKFFIER